MARERQFKHIAVTPADGEDVVIHAGVVEDAPSEDDGDTCDFEIPDGVFDAEAPNGGDREDGLLPKGVPEDGALGEATSRYAPASRRNGGYREATLEDLESSRMPITQKIVIIAAVVLIIVAIVYYFMVMR